jgi:nitrogen regulatory protein PII
MTATEVKGHGRQKGFTEMYRGAEYRTSVRSESHQSNRIIPPITGAFSETMGSSKWVPTTELRIETVVHGEVVGR